MSAHTGKSNNFIALAHSIKIAWLTFIRSVIVMMLNMWRSECNIGQDNEIDEFWLIYWIGKVKILSADLHLWTDHCLVHFVFDLTQTQS